MYHLCGPEIRKTGSLDEGLRTDHTHKARQLQRAGRSRLLGKSFLVLMLFLSLSHIAQGQIIKSADPICAGGSVDLSFQLEAIPTGAIWTLTGGTPSTSGDLFPTVTYSSANTYNIFLSGHSFSFSLNSGRIAGEEAAEYVLKK